MCLYVCNSIRSSVSGLLDPSCPVVLTIKYSFIHSFIEYELVMDGQTDRQTDGQSTTAHTALA